MAAITIVSVSYRSSSYLAPLLQNLFDKARDRAELRVLIVDNTNGADPELRGALSAVPSLTLVPFDTGPVKGSRAHAKGLDFAMSKLETEFAVVVDPDIFVFKDGWDRLCQSELARLSAFAMGAPYPGWKVGKYHDFPSPPFCFFQSAALRELGVGWEPFGETKLEDARALVTRQIGRLGNLLTRRRYERHPSLRRYASWAEKTLGVFGPDTGWRIAEAAAKRGLRSVLFEASLATAADIGSERPHTEREARARLVSEFELYTYAGEPIMTHKYGSGARPWRTPQSHDLALWRECIELLDAASKAGTRDG
jgi:hypothetical protein